MAAAGTKLALAINSEKWFAYQALVFIGFIGWGGRIRTYEWRDQTAEGPYESITY
jgi:hypothetical protein